MKLVVDAQLLQTPDADRGMGLYYKSIMTALAKRWRGSSHEHELIIITNSNLKYDSEVGEYFSKLFTNTKIIRLALSSKAHSDQTYGDFRRSNKDIINEGVAQCLDGETRYIYFIPAQFSNDIFPVFPDFGDVIKVQLFHDLIPLLFSEKYFNSYESKSCIDYCQRFSGVYESDFIVTNSQTTADDLGVYLGFSNSRTFAILGSGADRSGVPPAKPKGFSVPSKYILMPSGDDLRKNNLRGVQAFAAARDQFGDDIKLVVTSSFSEGTKSQLLSISEDVVFSGNVPDSEYNWLIKNAECVFFPTEYEGLGMPIIEAAGLDVPIVCSSISVFKEISTDAFVYCSPYSVQDMSSAIVKTLTKPRIHTKEKFSDILARFNWDKTAELFEGVLNTADTHPRQTEKKKIAIFSPRVDSYSAIGKYVLETHAELSKKFDIEYYFESGRTEFKPTRLNLLEHVANSFDASDFDFNRSYDDVLCHIGNSEFHINTILGVLKKPASILLHDCKLNGIFEYMNRNSLISAERFDAEGVLSSEYADIRSTFTVSLLDRADKSLCHSRYVSDVISANKSKPTTATRIFHPIATPRIYYKQSDQREITISFAGIIAPEKGFSLIESIAKLPGVRVKLFGFSVLGHDGSVAGIPNLTIIKDLSDFEFQENLKSSDILINYREKYNGETSRTALEAMRSGVNVIVKDVGWFSELPDDAVVKVKNTHAIMDQVVKLVANKKMRSQLSEAARKYTNTELGFEKYATLLESTLGAKNE